MRLRNGTRKRQHHSQAAAMTTEQHHPARTVGKHIDKQPARTSCAVGCVFGAHMNGSLGAYVVTVDDDATVVVAPAPPASIAAMFIAAVLWQEKNAPRGQMH